MSPLELEYLTSYLDEYYGSFSEENRTIGNYILSETLPGATILDVGCGPSFIYWSMFHPSAKKIIGLDIKEDSVFFVKQELDKIKRHEISTRYLPIFKYVAGLDLNFFDNLEIVRSNLSERWPIQDNSIDLVTSVFGMDCLSSMKEFEFALSEAKRVLVTNGKLILITLANTPTWKCGGVSIDCLQLNENILRSIFTQHDFLATILKVKASTAIEKSQGYDSMFFCSIINKQESELK
jgi:ubiquinone/menaquinone biosynthesis C-methylase UbiE